MGLVVAYALLGATWLVMKSESTLQNTMRRTARGLLLTLLAVIAVISLWTPLVHSQIAERWFSLPNLYYLLPVPLLVIIASALLWRHLGRDASHVQPFILTLVLIFLGFSGLGISMACDYPAIHHALAGGGSRAKSGIYADWRPVYYSGYPGVHLLELLRISRQSAAG